MNLNKMCPLKRHETNLWITCFWVKSSNVPLNLGFDSNVPPQNTNKINLRHTSSICSNQDFDSRRSWKYRVFHEDQKARRGGWTNKISAVNIWDASSAGSELELMQVAPPGAQILNLVAKFPTITLRIAHKCCCENETFLVILNNLGTY